MPFGTRSAPTESADETLSATPTEGFMKHLEIKNFFEKLPHAHTVAKPYRNVEIFDFL